MGKRFASVAVGVAVVGFVVACGGDDTSSGGGGALGDGGALPDGAVPDGAAEGGTLPADAGAMSSCGVWTSKGGASSNLTRVEDIAVTASAAFVVGRFDNMNDFGGGTVSPVGTDGFLVKLDVPGLAYGWSTTSAAAGTEDWSAVAGLPGGDVLVGGRESGVDAGAGLTLFVARLGGANGAPVWKKTFTVSDTSGSVQRVRVASDGDVFVLGTYETKIQVDGFTLTNDGMSPDLWYARLDPTSGAAKWAKATGASGFDGQNDVAFEPGGDVIVVGERRSSGSFTPGARFTRIAFADGSTVFDRGASPALSFAVGAGPSGLAGVAGFAQGGVDLGAGTVDAGTYSRMTAAYLTTDGGLAWAALDPDTAQQRPFLHGALLGDDWIACTASLECTSRALADGARRALPTWGTFGPNVSRMIASGTQLYAAGQTSTPFVFGGQTYVSGASDPRPFLICASP